MGLVWPGKLAHTDSHLLHHCLCVFGSGHEVLDILGGSRFVIFSKVSVKEELFSFVEVKPKLGLNHLQILVVTLLNHYLVYVNATRLQQDTPNSKLFGVYHLVQTVF